MNHFSVRSQLTTDLKIPCLSMIRLKIPYSYSQLTDFRTYPLILESPNLLHSFPLKTDTDNYTIRASTLNVNGDLIRTSKYNEKERPKKA